MRKKKPSPKKKPPRRRGAPKWLAHIADDLRPLAMPISELTADSGNARRHSPQNIDSIVASLRQFGQRKPIVVNVSAGAVVEAGNGTLEAARRLDWTHIAAVKVLDDPATHHGFSIADNRTAELGDWDDALLAELIAEMQEETPDLATGLLLDDLLQKGVEEEDSAGDGQAGGQDAEPESWQVVVDCGDEETQKKLFEEMKDQGFSCRLLTL